MNNIHLLPTDKPSRLQKTKHNNFFLANRTGYEYTDCTAQHIYITSDEEIKDCDYAYFPISNEVLRIGNGPFESSLEIVKDNKDSKKIILTTDQDLIKDGVQAIDDEFLEWFVKNPSCEEVKWNAYPISPNGNIVATIRPYPFKGLISNFKIEYKIIIPKEEPKQETLEEVDEIEKIAMDKLKSKWEHLYTFGYPQKPFPTNYENDLNMVKIGLYESAKWAQERMYSEEEVLKLLISCKERFGGSELYDYVEDSKVIKWFERCKKK